MSVVRSAIIECAGTVNPGEQLVLRPEQYVEESDFLYQGDLAERRSLSSVAFKVHKAIATDPPLNVALTSVYVGNLQCLPRRRSVPLTDLDAPLGALFDLPSKSPEEELTLTVRSSSRTTHEVRLLLYGTAEEIW